MGAVSSHGRVVARRRWPWRQVALFAAGLSAGVGGTLLAAPVAVPPGLPAGLFAGLVAAVLVAVVTGARITRRTETPLPGDAVAALRQFAECAPDAIVVTDMRGRIRFANRQMQALLGYDADELAGTDLSRLMPQAMAARHDQYMTGYSAGRRAMTAEGREVQAVHKAGHEVPVHVRVGQMDDGGERVFVGFLRDMSERRRAQEALRHSEEKLRKLYAMSTLGIALTDMSGRFLDFNEAFVALTGHDATALRSLSYWDLTPVEFAAQEAANLESLETTGRYGPYEKDYVGPRGERRPVRLNGVRIQLDGQPCIWSIVEDLTERRRVEQDHERLQRQLMQAQKMEALGQLTGGIAHNFNNMLAGILGLSTLALERHVDDPQGRLATYLREIIRVGERGRDLVGRLMTFSRPGTPLPEAPRAVGPVVDEVVHMLQSTMPATLHVSQRSEADLPPVHFADVDLHQAVANLVINARDAVDGCGEVLVELAATDAAGAECASCGRLVHGPHLAVRVHDSGGGIAPDLRSRIFDPFFTTKDVGKGTGLGLATVHTLVHGLGGHVAVRDRPTGGTTFELLLPAAPAVAGSGIPVPAAAPRVWIVDEDPVMLNHLGDLLRADGHEVIAFDDPGRAIEALRGAAGTVDHLVTDLGSPGLAGHDLARVARALNPQVNVVLCTSQDGPPDDTTARVLGQHCWLRKPIAPGALAAALRRRPRRPTPV